jgi:hypothetical protein
VDWVESPPFGGGGFMESVMADLRQATDNRMRNNRAGKPLQNFFFMGIRVYYYGLMP